MKNLRALILAWIVLLSSYSKTACFAGPAQDADDQGQALQDSGKITESLPCYEKAVAIDPNFALAHLHRGKIYAMAQERQKALADFNCAIRLNPRLSEAFCWRGDMFSIMDSPTKAFADYARAIELNPNNDSAYSSRAYLYGKLGKYAEQFNDYDRTVSLSPTVTFVFLGNEPTTTDEQNDRLKKTIEACSRVINANPVLGAAYAARALAKSSLKDKAGAKNDFIRAIKFAPRLKVPYYWLAYCDEYATAAENIANWSKLIELEPDNAEFYECRGDIYDAKTESKEKLNDYTTAMKLAPNLAMPYFDRARVYQQMGNLGAAESDIRNYIKRDAHYPSAYKALADIESQRGQWERAVDHYSQADSIRGTNATGADVFVGRGNAYSHLHQGAKALADFNSAISVDPKCTVAYVQKALLSFESGNLSEAFDSSLKAARLQPNYPLFAAIAKWAIFLTLCAVFIALIVVAFRKSVLPQFSSAALLLICTSDSLPSDFYVLSKFLICALLGYTAYRHKTKRRIVLTWLFALMSAFFNPFIPVHLEQETWSAVDLASAILIVVVLLASSRKARIEKIAEPVNQKTEVAAS